MALSPAEIAKIYAKRRTKGLYTELLAEFIASGEAGISVRDQWPNQFAWDASKVGPDGKALVEGDSPGKLATTLKQGFENAKDRKESPDGAEHVDVIVDGEEVYLLNRAAMEAGLAPESDEVEEEDNGTVDVTSAPELSEAGV